MLRINRLAAAVVLAVALGSLAVVAQAAIPDSSGVIHGCILPSGQLRVIDSSTQTCGENETAITWNQQGQPGPAGAAGPAGPTGTPGVSGYNVVTNTQFIPQVGTPEVTATCPSGQRVLGGGFSSPPPGLLSFEQASQPISDGSGWEVVWDQPSLTAPFTVYAICANVNS